MRRMNFLTKQIISITNKTKAIQSWVAKRDLKVHSSTFYIIHGTKTKVLLL